MHRATIARLRDEVAQRIAAERRALEALEDSVSVLARAIESRDIVTGDHVDRMSSYCALIGAELGMPVEDQHRLALAARLHDVGTVAVPDRLLLKGGVLDEPELWVMQSHCQAGYEILSGSSSPVLQLAAEIALTHHEWFDGCGYPRGLEGVDIPLVGTDRRHRGRVRCAHQRATRIGRSLTPEAAIELMQRERGTHFDPSCSTCSSPPRNSTKLDDLAQL